MIHGLPERLRALRAEMGYSQREVAKRLEVSPAIISGYETGERTPSTENLLALSYLYHCSTDYLLGRAAGCADNGISVEGLSVKQTRLLQELAEQMRRIDAK